MSTRRIRGLIIAGIGLALILVGGVTTAEFRYRLSPTRLVIEPNNLLVTDDEQHIVVGSGKGKVQVYGPERRVSASWTLVDAGQPFRLALADGRIQVATLDGTMLRERDLDGELVRETEDAGAYERIGGANERAYTTPAGVRFRIEEGRILRTGPDGRDEIMVDGFADHSAMTAQMVVMGVCMFAGAGLLIGGFLSTGRRAVAAGSVAGGE